jgi:hypothetical protein
MCIDICHKLEIAGLNQYLIACSMLTMRSYLAAHNNLNGCYSEKLLAM